MKKLLFAVLFGVLLSGSALALAADVTTGLKIDLRNNQSNTTDVIDWVGGLNYTLTSGATFNSTFEYTYQVNNSSYLRSPSSALFNIGSSANRNGSYVAWYYIPPGTTRQIDLFTIAAGNASVYAYCQLQSSLNFRVDTMNSTGTSEFQDSSMDCPTGTWFMVGLTINSAGLTQSYLGNESGQVSTGSSWTPSGGQYITSANLPMLFGSSGNNNPVGGGLGCFRMYNVSKTQQDFQALLEMGHSCDNSTISLTSSLTTTNGTSRLYEAPNVHTGWILSNVTIQANNFTARLDCTGDGTEDCNVTQAAAAKTRELFQNISVEGATIRAEMSLESIYTTSTTPAACSQSDYGSYCMQLALNKWASENGYRVKWQITYMPAFMANTTNGLCSASGSNRSCAPKKYTDFASLAYNHSRLIGCGVYDVCEYEVWNEPDLRSSAFLYNNLSSVGSTAYRGNLTLLHTSLWDAFNSGTSNTFWMSPMSDVFDANASTARQNLMADLQTAGYNTRFKVPFHFYLGAWSNNGKYSTLLNSAYNAVLSNCVTYGFTCTDLSNDEWNTYYAANQNASSGTYNYTLNQAQLSNALYFYTTYNSVNSYSSFFEILMWQNYSVNSSAYPRYMSAVNSPGLTTSWYGPGYDPLWRYTTYHAGGSTVYSCSNGDSAYIDCLVTKRSDGRYFMTLNNNGDLDRTVRVTFSGLTVTSVNSTRNSTTYTATANVATLTSINGQSSNTFELTVADTNAPVITVTSPTNTTYTNASILISFNATDNETSVNTLWYYNGTANVTYTAPLTTILVDGYYTFIFYANDTLGNTNSTTVTFTVSTPVPTPEDEICTNSGDGIAELASWLPIIALCVGAAIVFGAIYIFQNGGSFGLDLGGMSLGTIAILFVVTAITISIAARIIVSALC